MKYTEELAEDIIKRYGLTINNKYLWRKKGRIPNRYSDKKLYPTQDIPSDVANVIKTDWISKTEISKSIGISSANLSNKVKGLVRFTPKEICEIRKVVMRVIESLEIVYCSHDEDFLCKWKGNIDKNKMFKVSAMVGYKWQFRVRYMSKHRHLMSEAKKKELITYVRKRVLSCIKHLAPEYNG